VTTTHHIVHDTDRDGWGSAALMLATLKADHARLYPQRGKDICGVLNAMRVSPGDRIYVLDIPAPADWSRLTQPACELIWVDHHMASWTGARPSWFRAVLGSTDKPTTTMILLVQAQIVLVPHAIAFITNLCRRSPPYEWGLVFDALQYGRPPNVEGFEELLALAPHGGSVPESLRHVAQQSVRRLQTVRAALDAAPSSICNEVAVFRLACANGIQLRHYSLEIARRYPKHVGVLVHRTNILYAARNGGPVRLDLLAHFRGRGFDAKGHPHVCFVDVKAAQVEAQIATLVLAVKRGGS
jgi:hypothetical protein